MNRFTKIFVCLVVLIAFSSPAFARSKPRNKYGHPRVTTKEIPNCYMVTKDGIKINLTSLCSGTAPAQPSGTNTPPANTPPATPVKK